MDTTAFRETPGVADHHRRMRDAGCMRRRFHRQPAQEHRPGGGRQDEAGDNVRRQPAGVPQTAAHHHPEPRPGPIPVRLLAVQRRHRPRPQGIRGHAQYRRSHRALLDLCELRGAARTVLPPERPGSLEGQRRHSERLQRAQRRHPAQHYRQRASHRQRQDRHRQRQPDRRFHPRFRRRQRRTRYPCLRSAPEQPDGPHGPEGQLRNRDEDRQHRFQRPDRHGPEPLPGHHGHSPAGRAGQSDADSEAHVPRRQAVLGATAQVSYQQAGRQRDHRARHQEETGCSDGIGFVRCSQLRCAAGHRARNRQHAAD